jgi:histidinol-phosphate aminotransferase
VRLSVPTYPLIRVLCDVYAARQVESPWPLQAGAEATVTVIANPNSPTGQWLPPDELRNFIAAQTGIVVIDEAYAPFTGYSAIAFLLDFPNLIVVRTFSKAYSLAGMRVGYALADPVLIDEIRSAHLPYPTSTCGLAAASVALADGHRLEQMIALVVAERSRVQRELLVLGWDAPPSHGNFLYVRPPAGTALDACETLARNGVLIRYFPGIDKDRLRVTISSSSSNDAFLTAARSIAHDL